MPLTITALYAGVLTIIVLGLSFRAGAMRGKKRISIGDGGDMQLLEAVRRHGNAIEYVPLALILLGVLELNGASNAWLHGLGGVLVIARITHAIGLKADNIAHPLRAVGAGGTALMMVVAAGYAIWQFVSAAT